MNERIQFNTGRLYQKDGQIIVAEIDRVQGTARFNDTSRMITGIIDLEPFYLAGDKQRLIRQIMWAYDHNQYKNDGCWSDRVTLNPDEPVLDVRHYSWR